MSRTVSKVAVIGNVRVCTNAIILGTAASRVVRKVILVPVGVPDRCAHQGTDTKKQKIIEVFENFTAVGYNTTIKAAKYQKD